MPELEIHHGDEWAALYVDGKLERVGDSYVAEERALEICGVTVLYDNSFMQGQTQSAGVAQTLDEVNAYRIDRAEKAVEAEQLREQAARLLAEAEKLDGKKSP